MLFLLGIFFCVYPYVNKWTAKAQYDELSYYEEVVDCLGENQAEEIMEKARAYNCTAIAAPRDYQQLLNPAGNGIMCSIRIPKLNLSLPVYHGTEEETLEKGIGHLYGSSLPVGGSGSHSLLAGHRGLPGAKLFTELDKLELGDAFEIHVCGSVLSYLVCDISVIEPKDTKILAKQQGRDLVSLITCTPYGINTHRLVVTGEREDGI